MDANNITETEALQIAIDHFQQQAPRNCGVMYEPYMAVVKWLQELSAFKDETPITDKFLTRQFVDTRAGWRCNCDDTKILIQKSADTYHVLIFKREYEENKAYIKTLGELRMFLTLCGLVDFANQLKS